jgi:hypothetical protein
VTATSTASSLVSLGVSTEEEDYDGRRRRRRLKLIPRSAGDGRRRLGADDGGGLEAEDAPLTLVLQVHTWTANAAVFHSCRSALVMMDWHHKYARPR